MGCVKMDGQRASYGGEYGNTSRFSTMSSMIFSDSMMDSNIEDDSQIIEGNRSSNMYAGSECELDDIKLSAWKRYSTKVNNYVDRRTPKDKRERSFSIASTKRVRKAGYDEIVLPEMESLISLVNEYTSFTCIARLRAWCLYYCTVPANDVALDTYGSLLAIEEVNKNLRRAWAAYEMIIMHPLSTLRFYWDMVTIVLLLVQLFILPLQLTQIITSDDEDWRDILIYLNLLTDMWFIMD